MVLYGYADLLNLATAWARKAQELDDLLSNEKDPVKRAELYAEVRVLKLCSDKVWDVANSEKEKEDWLHPASGESPENPGQTPRRQERGNAK